MSLQKFGLIVVGAELDGRMVMDSARFYMVVVGVRSIEIAVEAARRLVEDDRVQLIELCGAFGPIGSARVIEAIGRRVPVGSVYYGAEALAGLAKIFS